MKNILFLLIAPCFLLLGTSLNTASAQATAQLVNEKKQFVADAEDIGSRLARVEPEIKAWRQAAVAKNNATEVKLMDDFMRLGKEAQSLAAKIKTAGENMSDSKLVAFKRELSSLDTKYDDLLGDNNPMQPRDGDTRRACKKACEEKWIYRPWKRFWCKRACFFTSMGSSVCVDC